jgi:hypothetical protein
LLPEIAAEAAQWTRDLGTRICSAVITGSAGVGVAGRRSRDPGASPRRVAERISARLRPATTLLGDLASEGGYCG